ncbi:DUF4328 domain-containing protein [Novosphingobium sp. BL-8A]|uniref:DUF4328 domain-containing protein n=1 Tax=Novosphingobium sp. BL-8A TaxID=3127639 RepID=UPI0037569B88
MTETSLAYGLAIMASRTKVVRMTLWAYIGLAAASAVGLCAAMASGEAAGQISTMITGLMALLIMACAIPIGMWIHRAHANLFAAGLEGLDYTPGWSVGWFFIPIASLFKPFSAMRELWERSHLQSNAEDKADYRLVAWWTCWLIGQFAGNVASRIPDPAAAGGLSIIRQIFGIAAAWFLLEIVNGIARAQTSDLEAGHAFA